MKKFSILFTILLVIFSNAVAQNASVKGAVVDTLAKQNLSNAVVALLRAKDSVLVKFVRSDKSGNFELKNAPSGNYNVVISYPSFADYSYPVTLTENSAEDIGAIKMTLMARLLQEVIVRQKIAAVRIKGDTVEYKADSFKVRDGASVEEMLRKLPGLTVDKDGKITAQGEKVEKVLVDGEEFFGDDPTIATKNIEANAIDKVQVFDKKSDQAVFSGIDDGSKTKTLNLTLKEDKKKGYFGKVELASDVRNRWNNNLMLNSFRSKRKLSVYGIMSNTGKTGLNWEESSKYGENNNMEMSEDGGFFFSNNSGDEFDNYGSFSGEGLPTSWAGGAQYSKKYNDDKQNINGSYRYNKLNTSGFGNTVSQSILPGNIFIRKESRESFNSKQRHSLNAVYDNQLDSFTSIKVKSNGFTGTQNSFTQYNTESLDERSNAVIGFRNTSVIGNNKSYNSNILLRRRFKKAGRTFSLNFDQQYKKTNSTGFLLSVNNFLDSVKTKNIDTVDQQKINEVTNEGYYTKVAYTEPIVKNIFLELSYGIRVSNSESGKLTYDATGSGKYDNLNDTFSNNYRFNVLTNSAGMVWRYNGKKTTVSAGGDVAHADFKQRDLLRKTDFRYNFNNFFPKASYIYKFSSNGRVSLNYNGSTRQPSIDQIQPIRDNADPLNIAIGNPDLKQEFRHSFNLNYNSYKVLKQRGFYTYAGFNTTANSISTNETTIVSGDSAGTRVFQYVNLNGNYNGYSGGGYHFRVSKADINFHFGLNVNVNRINNIVSTLDSTKLFSGKNTTDNNRYGFSFNVSKFKEKKYDVNYRTEISYNTSKSTVNTAAVNNYFLHTHNLSGTLTLPYKFEINSNVEADFRQKTTLFSANNNVILWNAYIGRKLFKNDKGLISIKVNDILNQNRGYSRFVSSNIISENNFQTLRRYFLLSFTFNFSKNPAGASMP